MAGETFLNSCLIVVDSNKPLKLLKHFTASQISSAAAARKAVIWDYHGLRRVLPWYRLQRIARELEHFAKLESPQIKAPKAEVNLKDTQSIPEYVESLLREKAYDNSDT